MRGRQNDEESSPLFITAFQYVCNCFCRVVIMRCQQRDDAHRESSSSSSGSILSMAANACFAAVKLVAALSHILRRLAVPASRFSLARTRTQRLFATGD